MIASGSNTSPNQLHRKYHGRTNAPIHTILCEFDDLIPVYSSHFASYGAKLGLPLASGRRTRALVRQSTG